MVKMKKLPLMEYTKERFKGISYASLNSMDECLVAYEGAADIESNTLVDEDTIFPACSISKFVTAFCVMRLYEQEMIDIDAPVNQYLKEWKFRTTDGKESAASVRSLLCHVAGVVDGEDAFYGLRRKDPKVSLIDILDGKTSYNDHPIREENAPGSAFEYSDGGYCILQLMVQEVTGKSFEEFGKEYLFEPLNLKNTFFASLENIDVYEKKNVMATGYDEEGVAIPGKYPQVPDLAASGLWSTPKELLVIAKEFIKACKGKSSLLQEKSAREIAKPVEQFTWTGLGVFMGAENEIVSRGWGENGQCMMRINYATGEIAVVMANQNPGVDQAESGLEEIINRKNWE